MTEPDLAPGESGEWVVQLQTRLHALGRYTGAVDGEYGESTEAAVLALQRERGLTADGKVGLQTWAALGELVPGDLSEDQQWRWEGTRWEPLERQAAVAAYPENPVAGVSRNGEWMWDGSKWQPVNQ